MGRNRKPITATPLTGGVLVTRGSHEKVGFANYVTKRDWRREEDQEIRREGHDYFKPLADLALGNQPYPQNQPTAPGTPEPITLEHMSRRTDGRTAFLVGTPSKLYRFQIEDGPFFEEDVDAVYTEGPILGPNLVTVASGNHTVNGFTVGKKYRWKPGAGELDLTMGVTTYESYLVASGLWWHPDVGVDFIATATTASVQSGGANGTVREVIEEEYDEPLGSGAVTCVNATATMTYIINGLYRMFLNGVLFEAKTPAIIAQPQVEFLDDGTVIGNDATVTWNGTLLLIKMDAGVTTRDKVEEKVKAQAPTFTADWNVAGSRYTAEDGGPYFEATGVGQPYFADANSSWKVIGSGFSTAAARWEAKEHNGYTVLNNGVDPMMTYRVGDEAVSPIYELREQGIAALGTMEVYGSILMGFDSTQIKSARMDTLFTHTDSGSITASQVGSQYSGSITATQVGATNDVQSSAAFFDAGWVGRTIQFENGFTTTISAFVNTSRVTLTATPTTVGATPMVFWVINLAADYLVTSSLNFFTAAMVGKRIFWDSGETRKITAYNSPTSVTVDNHPAIASGLFKVEGDDPYRRFAESNNVDRFQHRTLWGMVDDPRRWAATIPGNMTTGSAILELNWPVKSLESGQSVVVLGAGAAGSNLVATILFVGENRTTVVLDRAASTTVTAAGVQRADAIGSIVGFQDLKPSPIVRGLSLDRSIVVYQESAIFVGRYTGNPAAPFDFGEGPVYEGTETPYYRNTVITVEGVQHAYAGRTEFYTFDLVSRTPKAVPLLQRMANVFFAQARLENTNLIFSADNAMTKEIWICFPSTSDDKAIAFDYQYKSVSTIGTEYTAAALIKKPSSEILVGVTQDWFVTGDSRGRVLQYGKAHEPQPQWGDQSEIVHRLGSAYLSTLKSGLWGHPVHETSLTGYIPLMATQNPLGSPVTVKLYGYRNPSEPARLLATQVVGAPDAENLVATHFLENYFQDELTCSSLAQVRLAGKSVLAEGVASQSFIRRET